MKVRAPIAALGCALALTACSFSKDDVPRRASEDAGGIDASMSDGGPGADGGPVVDAGPTPDGGVADGGPGPDGGPRPSCVTCDPVAQEGCGAIDACQINPYAADGPAMCGTAGIGERGAGCLVTSDDSCAPGLSCAQGSWGCQPLCHEDSDCGEDEVCIDLVSGACVGMCSQVCSVLGQTGCAEPRPTCRPILGGSQMGNVCTSEGRIDAVESCGTDVDCLPGLTCQMDPGEPASSYCVEIYPCRNSARCAPLATVRIGTDPDGSALCYCQADFP